MEFSKSSSHIMIMQLSKMLKFVDIAWISQWYLEGIVGYHMVIAGNQML